MAQQSYTLYIGVGQAMPVVLPTDEPIYRLVNRLVHDYGLPPSDRYALYADHSRRLSGEMSLQQAGYDQGGALYLANANAPWWEQTPALTRRLPDRSQPKKQNDRRRLYALLGVGAAVVLTIGIAVAVLTLVSAPSPQVAQQPTVNSTAEMVVEQLPTSTLAPLLSSDTKPMPPAAMATRGLTATATLAPLSTSTMAASPTTMASPMPSFIVFPTATLADLYADAVTVVGVKREYLDRGERLFFQGRTSFGAYLWNEPELRTRLPASQGNVVISNGDRVAILSQENGAVHVRILTNALDPADPKVIGATGYLPQWLVFDEGVPPPAPTATPDPGKLFVYKLNEDDQPGCISMRIVKTNASGWSFVVDGTNLRGRFDNAGNARLCGLGADQEVTISVLDRNGRIIPGGRGVPSKGRAIMIGEWRQ